jgi:nitric oxide reductase large subunit
MRRKRLWLIEIWEEEREAFKAIVGHAALFLTVLGVLILVHYAISISNLHEGTKEILEKIDFWSIAIILVMLTVTSLCQLAVISIKKIRNGK